MGVTYKLKPEIIDAIIKRKTDRPNISCRQLAEDISSKFNVKISKSSVNTILKNSKLSSSVGRRTKKSATIKKFEIPAERKKQLEENVEKTGLGKTISTSREAIKPAKRKKKKKTSILDIESSPKGESREQSSEELSIRDKKLDETIKASVAKKNEDWSSPREGMGCVFLKIIQWEVGLNSRLISIFERLYERELTEEEKKALQIWFDFRLLGKNEFPNLAEISEHALWLLNDVFLTQERDGLFDIIKRIADFVNNADNNFEKNYKIAHELSQIFEQVKGVRINCTNQPEIYFDGFLDGVYSSAVDIGASAYINQAIDVLSERLISNKEPVIIGRIPNDDNRLETFNSLFKVLIAHEDAAIKSATIFDTGDEELTVFNAIPEGERNFITSIAPDHKYFETWTKSAKWAVKIPYFDLVFEQLYYISEIVINDTRFLPLPSTGLKLIMVWTENNDEPLAGILTNMNNESSGEIVKKYLNRHSLEENGDVYLQQPLQIPNNISSLENDSVSKVIEALTGKILTIFAATISQFDSEIDITTIIPDIYNIPGKLQKLNDHLVVNLDTASNQAPSGVSLLKMMAKNANFKPVFTKNGQKIALFIN